MEKIRNKCNYFHGWYLLPYFLMLGKWPCCTKYLTESSSFHILVSSLRNMPVSRILRSPYHAGGRVNTSFQMWLRSTFLARMSQGANWSIDFILQAKREGSTTHSV